MATPEADIRGDYTVESAIAQPYLNERMGDALKLAQATVAIFPHAAPPIRILRIENWPPEVLTPPSGMPYRIVCVYEAEFARFLACCELGDMYPTHENLQSLLADKSATDLRERYWLLTDELQVASMSGDQKAVISLSDERDVLAKLIAGRGEKIGHTA